MTFPGRLREYASAWLSRSWRWSLCTAAFFGSVLSVLPTVLLGIDAPLGKASIWFGVPTGATIGVVVGTACVLVMGKADYEGGVRAASFICSDNVAMRSVGLWVTAIAYGYGMVFSVVGFAVFGSSVDTAARGVTGRVTDQSLVGSAMSMVEIVGALATVAIGTTMVWLALVGLRSSRRCVLVIGSAIGSWLALLLATRAVEHRELLALHPLAGPWRALDLSTSPSLRVDAPPLQFLLSAAAWASLLLLVGLIRLRRP